MSGLPFLFSFFMRKEATAGKKKKKKGFVYKQSRDEEEEDEHYSVSLIVNIFRILKKAGGVNFDRVFYKFKENSFEKIDRLIELHKYYTEKVKNTPEDQDDANDGFYTLQLIDYVITLLMSVDDYDLNAHLKMLMNINNIEKDDVYKISESYTKTFEPEEEPEKPSISKNEFKTVSQNPSESESEEVASGNKRFKIGGGELNTEGLQAPDEDTS